MNALIVLNLTYGVVKPYSITSCVKPYNVINNIIEASRGFDFCFVINDCHEADDKEFQYLPQHSLKYTSESALLEEYFNKLQSKHKQVFTKKTLSGVFSSHNRFSIEATKCDNIVVVGFCASTDIVPTCLSLIDQKQKIAIIPSCIGDVLEESRTKALDYLKYLGIPEFNDLQSRDGCITTLHKFPEAGDSSNEQTR
jgi:nicotinamidase-related amidase